MHKRIVVVQIGTGFFGVEICHVHKIVAKAETLVVMDKNTPQSTETLSWNDYMVPVLNLHERFGQCPPAADGCFMLLGEGRQMIAFAMNRVDKYYDVSADCLFALPSVLRNPDAPYFQEIARCNGKLVLMLNVGFMHSLFEREDNYLGQNPALAANYG